MAPGSAQAEHMLTQPAASLSIAAIKDLIDGMDTPQIRWTKHYIGARMNEDVWLFKIPPELRNRIYAHVIEQHLEGFVASYYPVSKAASDFIPPLFELSRQLRSEGLSLLFADYMRVSRLDVPDISVPGIFEDGKFSREFTSAEAQELSFKPARDAELLGKPCGWATRHGYDQYLWYASDIYDDFNTCLVYRRGDPHIFRTFMFNKIRSSYEGEVSEA